MKRPHQCSGCGQQGHNISSCQAVPGREGKVRCATCKDWLPTDNFNVKNKTTGKLQRLCKECIKPYKRRWYRKHHKEQVERTLKNREFKKEVVRSLKSNPCTDCGQTFHWCVMDFDHREGFDKVADVAVLLQKGVSLDVIRAEIAKCDLVCSNCHRLRTWNRLTPKKRESIRQAVIEGHERARQQGIIIGKPKNLTNPCLPTS